MTAYPTEPTDIIDTTNIFASSSVSRVEMSTSEILDGYNNDGESITPLTSTPDGNKFNDFWYKMHTTVAWLVNYVGVLYSNKLETSGGTLSGALAMGANKITGLSDGTGANDAVNKGQLDTSVSGAMWLGEVKELTYPSIPTLPSGMVVVPMDGRAVSRTTYSEYFSLVTTQYGEGNGSTTFNIPSKLGKSSVGWDSVGTLDGGRSFGSDQKRESSKFTYKYDYANPVSKVWGTSYTATTDGIVTFYARCNSGQTGYFTINSNTVAKNYNGTDGVTYLQGEFPISKGDTYQASGATGGATDFNLNFIPKVQTSDNSTNTQTNIALYPVIRIK